MHEVHGWYSVFIGKFAICRGNNLVVTVDINEFERISKEILADVVSEKCVLYPFICPDCAGWTAQYKSPAFQTA